MTLRHAQALLPTNKLWSCVCGCSQQPHTQLHKKIQNKYWT